MKLPLIHRLDRQDLVGGGDVPGWADSLLSVLNAFIDPVAKALQGRLTFADNFACQVTQQTFTHGQELQIRLTGQGSFFGIIPVYASNKNAIAGYAVNPIGNGQLGVTINFGAGAGTQALVKIIILMG